MKLKTHSVKHKKREGFSLLELLIYIAIFGGIVLMSSSFLVTMVGGRDETNARFEVLENSRFASERIRQMVYDSSSFQVLGECPLNSLEVVSGGATSTVSIVSGVLRIAVSGGGETLISDRVLADAAGDCLFKKIANPSPAKPTLQLRLKISYNDNGNPRLQFFDEIKTTISQR